MKTHTHPLLPNTPGSVRSIRSEHFGESGERGKVYIQAALHADETPAILVATHLRDRLIALEKAGRMQGEVVLVALANPPGLAQWVMAYPSGRFELGSGRNYNRDFPLPFEKVADAVSERLGQNVSVNCRLIRQAWRDVLLDCAVKDEFESLQRCLLMLAHDADVVLDLHCSREATMHVYTAPAVWSQIQPLACLLGARASLLAVDSGARSFDEALSLMWWHLGQRFADVYPIPHASSSATIELRGQRDVSHAYAQQDSDAIIQYLLHLGFIKGEAAPLPGLPFPATPLAGSEQFTAGVSGVLVHRAEVGAEILEGDALFDIVCPETGEVTTTFSRTAGIFYMRRDTRFVRVGDPLGRVSGAVAIRQGMLLGA